MSQALNQYLMAPAGKGSSQRYRRESSEQVIANCIKVDLLEVLKLA